MEDVKYVLDDLLELQFQCNRYERAHIIREIIRMSTGYPGGRQVQIINAFFVNGVLSVVFREKPFKVQKCICWHMKRGKTDMTQIPLSVSTFPVK